MTKRKYSYEFSEYRQYKCCRCGRTMHEPTPHICNGQYSKYNLEFWKKVMENEISIKKEDILKEYNQASEEQKALLENMFGKDMFRPKDIRERIKTFHDAYCELGNEHPFVKSYEKYINTASGEEVDIIAYLKLRIICAALNEGWKPKFTKNEYRWYPCFTLWSEDELKDKPEGWKTDTKLWLFGGASNNASYCGLACADSYHAWPSSYSSYSARLVVKSEELADYFGKQFIDIWADYLFR